MLFQLVILTVAIANSLACKTSTEVVRSTDWWTTTAFYQIYPRSFKDSDGDGIGDLKGITSKLEHLVDAGAGGLWLSPFYPSPLADFGYDISNFTDIDPSFGTLEDFDELVSKAKNLGLKVILDFVPNHSSVEHDWFKRSIRREDPYTDYYVWKSDNGPDDTGEHVPPNNWLSGFQGSAWEWNEERGQYYYHNFAKAQPDLNYRSEYLRKEMENVLTFWLKRGIEGFRVDAINHLYEDERCLDEPLSNIPGVTDGQYEYLVHIYTRDLIESYETVQSWRDLLDNYSEETGTDTKVLMTEVYGSVDVVQKHYGYGSNVPFNFGFITSTGIGSTAAELESIIVEWLEAMPEGYVANWVIGNHDRRRAANRYGAKREDQMSIICAILPGVSVTYNGDEIGMVDTDISWEDTVDPLACSNAKEHLDWYTRDPERTPFQWDNTTHAGFTSGPTTWLPVNENYVYLNLEAQKNTAHSHYHVYQAMAALRELPILKRGSTSVKVLGSNTLAIVRYVRGAPPIIALVNCGETIETLNVKASFDALEEMTVYTSSVSSNITPGTNVTTTSLQLPGAATVVITSQKLYQMVVNADGRKQ